jgi:hypothetical protein
VTTRSPSRATLTGIAAVSGVLMTVALASPADAATSWRVLSTPDGGTIANELYGTAALSPTSAWAVGSWYDGNRAAPRTMVQRWNGTAWSIVGSPNATDFYNELASVDAVSATDAWAVGYANTTSGVNGTPRDTLAMRWNGTAWSIVATPNPGVTWRELDGVRAFSATDAWAVGWYYEASFTADTLTLHWNGSAWSQVATDGPGDAANYFTDVAGVASNDVWAVGSYNNAGDPRGLRHPLAMHYNGTAWTTTPLPETAAGGYLRGVTALASNNVWAVGSKNGYATPLAYHWDGSAWSEVPTAALSGSTGGNNLFYGVAGTAADQVWAVGYQSSGGQPQPLVQRWNGTAFVNETLPSLKLGASLAAVAATNSGPTVFAAGTQIGSLQGNRYDRTLSLLGTGA